MLSALRTHAQTAERKNSVGVMFTVDEESRMAGARAFAAGPLAEFRSRLRGIVVGEPTAMRPVVATNGVVRWRTITRGLAAHSSDPSRGRSAISAMVRVIDALEQHYVPAVSRVHPLTGRAAVSINVIAGGTAVNVIPDYCEILCDRRLVPGEDANDVWAQRDAVLRDLPAVEHDSAYVVPPLSETATADLYRWARPALIAAGGDPQPSGAAYVTNGSIYAAAGAPVLVLGPGEAAQAHTRDEWIASGQLSLAERIYRSLMATA
jgi:acetylornithine deacetylase